MKKMISFLGTNLYLDCYYATGNFKARLSRFVQTALFEMLQKEGEEIDKVYIFLTEEARERNYEDYSFKGKNYKGLKRVWQELFPAYADRLIPVPMKSGQLESEQWELFEQIYNLIEEGDELYFDITHSFRSNPVIALLISNFARIMKQASIKRLLYGNFETLGPAYQVENMEVEKRIAPIVDITSMVELLDWTVAVDSFLRTGNPVQIATLSRKKVRENNQDPDYRLIHGLAYQLSELNNSLVTCRGQQYALEVDAIFQRIKDIDALDESKLPQFSKLVDKINEKVSLFTESKGEASNELQKMWGSLVWCYEHGLYQQCLTLLREHILTIVSQKLDCDPLDEDKREAISRIILQTLQGNLNIDKLEKNTELVAPIQDILNIHPELKVYSKIAAYRNDINHANMKRTAMKYGKITNGIGELLKEIKPFFGQD